MLWKQQLTTETIDYLFCSNKYKLKCSATRKIYKVTKEVVETAHNKKCKSQSHHDDDGKLKDNLRGNFKTFSETETRLSEDTTSDPIIQQLKEENKQLKTLLSKVNIFKSS